MTVIVEVSADGSRRRRPNGGRRRRPQRPISYDYYDEEEESQDYSYEDDYEDKPAKSDTDTQASCYYLNSIMASIVYTHL